MVPPEIAAIVVGGRDEPPALVALARDVGLAGLALGVQRVEVLLQPLLGGLAGVDGAAAEAAAASAAEDRFPPLPLAGIGGRSIGR